MNETRPFFPVYQRTWQPTSTVGECLPSVTVAAVNATSVPSGVFPGQSGNNGNVQIQIANKTSVWVHVNFGIVGAVVAATIDDYPVAPGSVVVVSVDSEVSGAAVFPDGAPAGSASAMFTSGSGV